MSKVDVRVGLIARWQNQKKMGKEKKQFCRQSERRKKEREKKAAILLSTKLPLSVCVSSAGGINGRARCKQHSCDEKC